jgi:hypothetical protein
MQNKNIIMNLVDHSVTNCPYYYAPVVISYYN